MPAFLKPKAPARPGWRVAFRQGRCNDCRQPIHIGESFYYVPAAKWSQCRRCHGGT